MLIVDDVQWADRSTLDALMYVIAGPARRRLTVVTTLRAGEVGLGHPLQRWLADIRRLPRTAELLLGPLDRAATASRFVPCSERSRISRSSTTCTVAAAGIRTSLG